MAPYPEIDGLVTSRPDPNGADAERLEAVAADAVLVAPPAVDQPAAIVPVFPQKGEQPALRQLEHHGPSRRWVVIGAIAVAFLLVIGYVVGGAAATSGPVTRADSALKTTISHNNSMAALFDEDPFKGIDFKSDNPDVPEAKTAITTVRQDLSTWQAMVTSDRRSLLQVRADLNGSFLTLPEQSTIDSRRHRVDAALEALGTAQQAIDLASKQIAFLDPLLDVVAGFEAVVKAADAKDLPGMQAQLTTTAASVAKTVNLAQGAALPPQLTSGLTTLQKMVTDMQALVGAAQADDAAAVDKYAAAVEADGKALEAIDENAIDKAEKALIQPLSDAYDRDMKIAAGGLAAP